jgi:hypothetical protein
MDRFAAHIVATAVLTVALAAIPTAMAQPASSSATSSSDTGPSGTAPSSVPTKSPTSPATPSTSASTAPKASERELPPLTWHKRHEIALPPGCPDAFQVGPTEYARWHGAIAFSVKQFYSPLCRARFGYAHPWFQFRAAKVSFDLGMADFDLTHDTINGARTFVDGDGGPDFWSDPVSVPAGTCTQGLAHVFFPDTETDTFTDKFCG